MSELVSDELLSEDELQPKANKTNSGVDNDLNMFSGKTQTGTTHLASNADGVLTKNILPHSMLILPNRRYKHNFI